MSEFAGGPTQVQVKQPVHSTSPQGKKPSDKKQTEPSPAEKLKKCLNLQLKHKAVTLEEQATQLRVTAENISHDPGNNSGEEYQVSVENLAQQMEKLGTEKAKINAEGIRNGCIPFDLISPGMGGSVPPPVPRPDFGSPFDVPDMPDFAPPPGPGGNPPPLRPLNMDSLQVRHAKTRSFSEKA